MILFGGLSIVVALVRPRPPSPGQKGSPALRAALVGLMLAWALLLERVGFLTTSVAEVVAILLIANYDRWTPRRAVGYAVAATLNLGGLYAVLRLVLAAVPARQTPSFVPAEWAQSAHAVGPH